MKYNSIISAIPREWKDEISENGKLNHICSNFIRNVKINKNVNKEVYNKLTEKIKEEPNILEDKWKFQLNDDSFDVKIPFTLIFFFLT